MTQNVCIDGVAISDAAPLRVCVDGSQSEIHVDGTVAYDLATVAAPNLGTSTSFHAQNDNDGTNTECRNVAGNTWTPTNTGGPVTTYSIAAGALPTGMSINSGTGIISGTPTVAGNFSWTVRATNATGTSDHADSITIIDVADLSGSTSLDAANDNDGDITNGVAVTAWNPTQSQAFPGTLTYSIAAGALPPGLSINASSGQITGTPTTDGVYFWTVRASNKCGGGVTYVDGITVDTPAAAPNITTSTSLDALNDNDGDITNGAAITNWSPTSTGGPITSYSIVAGALPTGLSLNSGTGVISGTPTADGAYSWTVRATGPGGTSDFADSISVNTPIAAPNITTSATLDSLNNNDGEIDVNAAITAWSPTNTGGAVVSYAIIAGALPTGLSLNTSTGAITGTPTATGAFSWTVRATNGTGTSDFADSITVEAAGGIAAYPSIFPVVSNGIAFSMFFGSNGTINFSWDGGGSHIGNWSDAPASGVGDGWSIRASALSGDAVGWSNLGDDEDVWLPLSSSRTFIIEGVGITSAVFGSSALIQFSKDGGATVEAFWSPIFSETP